MTMKAFSQIKIIAVVFVIMVCNLNLGAEVTYYYELSNGGDGHFVTVTSQSCYDSDKNGISLQNGIRYYKGEKNGQYVFYGDSQWGFAYYYYSTDYQRLKVVVESSNVTYNYVRKTAPSNAISAHGAVPKNQSSGGAVIMPAVQTYNTQTTTQESTPIKVDTKCSYCNGTGYCTMCKGRGIYQNTYDLKWYDCPACHGTGHCQVCYGTGHVR